MKHIYDSKLLLVDDNRELLRMTSGILARNGYRQIRCAASAFQAAESFRAWQPDLIILDVMLPDGDGFSLFSQFRRSSQIPILFLSAKDQDQDRLYGLGLGADDYIVKPFLPQELTLRVGAILKRTYRAQLEAQEGSACCRIGSRTADFDRACVFWDDTVLPLTAKELILLQKLSQNRERVVTFDALCQAAWNDNYYGYENTLMVHIRHLREKIEEDPSHPRYLLTVRGLGYRLV